MMQNRYSQLLSMLLISSMLFLVATPVNAYKIQTPASIKQAVSEFLTKELASNDFTINGVDSRLRLKQCTHSLNTNFPEYAAHIGRTTIEVSCSSNKPWKILVTVYIKKYLNVLTAKHSMPTGSIITKNDISLKREDVSRVRGGYFTSASQLINMVVKRPIKIGKILSPALLKPKQLVSRGDDVLILANINNLKIRVKGKALMNGFLGQKIKVRNMNSRRIFQATVISSGLVKVNM